MYGAVYSEIETHRHRLGIRSADVLTEFLPDSLDSQFHGIKRGKWFENPWLRRFFGLGRPGSWFQALTEVDRKFISYFDFWKNHWLAESLYT
jgi:hypothetical protein